MFGPNLTHPGDIMREISVDLIRDTVARLGFENVEKQLLGE